MPGVGMKVTMWDRIPLGLAVEDLEDLDTLENVMAKAPLCIEALGKQIVEEMSEQAVVDKEVSKQSVWRGRLYLSI